MADQKLTETTETTSQDYLDLKYIVVAPGGTPISKKIAVRDEMDGWIGFSGTWTYASATTFTVAGDVTAILQTGVKLRLVQTTTKYFYVVSSSYAAPNTTVTITGGASYTFTNAAVSGAYYSRIERPKDFPQYFEFTPTVTPSAGAITSYTASGEFVVEGKLCWVKTLITITNNGTGSGYIVSTLPINCVAVSHVGCGRAAVNSGYQLQSLISSGSTGQQNIYEYDGTYPGSTNEIMVVEIVYRIAA
jgi:hypothetical protein